MSDNLVTRNLAGMTFTTHKHCYFCGEDVPAVMPSGFSSFCKSPKNDTAPDTVGNRYHCVVNTRDGHDTNSIITITPNNSNKSESVSAPAPDSRMQALNSLSRSEMEEGIYERVPAQEVTRPIEEQLWSLAMSVYHAGGNNHDFCEQATALLAYKPPAEEVAECDCDSCKAGDKEVLDYASLSAQRDVAQQFVDTLTLVISQLEASEKKFSAKWREAESTNTVLRSALEKVAVTAKCGRDIGFSADACKDIVKQCEMALAALQGETK